MSLSGDKGVAQFKKSVKMEHPNPHIIFNNYSKSAKVLASRKIEFQMKKNLNVEDNIGVPFGIRLKIRL